MVRLKSRNECPPGGFQVTIPQLNKTEQFWSFRDAAKWFYDMAIANPSLKISTDIPTIENYVDQQNALRCLGITGADVYVTQKGGPAAIVAETKKSSLLKPVVAVGDKMKQLVAGAKLLRDWLGEGGLPVTTAEAASRALTCATCPQNGKGDLSRWFTVPASEDIRREIENAKNLKLATPHDSALGICEACLCPLKLKVHVPLANIEKHLTPTTRAALDARCWILK